MHRFLRVQPVCNQKHRRDVTRCGMGLAIAMCQDKRSGGAGPVRLCLTARASPAAFVASVSKRYCRPRSEAKFKLITSVRSKVNPSHAPGPRHAMALTSGTSSRLLGNVAKTSSMALVWDVFAPEDGAVACKLVTG